MPAEYFQLVILKINDDLFAIDSSHFQEVIRQVVATPIPFVPGYIEGLVNIEGRIATQIDLGRFVSDRDTPSPGEELAFIHTGRSLCALRVQQVVSIVDFDPSDIKYFTHQPAADGKAGMNCVAGEFVHDGKNVLLLAPASIGLLVQSKDLPAGQGGLAGRVRARDIATSTGSHHYLVAYAGDERFGFAIDGITELVKSSHCTPIPGAPEVISGLTLVRGQPVLTAALRGLLDKTAGKQSAEAAWIILVEKHDLFVGLQVDNIAGIEVYDESSIIGLQHPDSTLRGVVENEGGELTMLVAPAALLSGSTGALLKRFMPANRQNRQQEDTDTRACLSVQICQEFFAIPLEIVSRVIQYKIPQALNDENQHISGAIDVDGRVVPVVNMEGAGFSTETTWSEYVIVENRQSAYAIRVNHTHRVIDMPIRNISRAKNTRNPFVAAVAQYDNSIYSLFNSDHLERFQTT